MCLKQSSQFNLKVVLTKHIINKQNFQFKKAFTGTNSGSTPPHQQIPLNLDGSHTAGYKLGWSITRSVNSLLMTLPLFD